MSVDGLSSWSDSVISEMKLAVEVRRLRNQVYGERISDESWANVIKNWMREDSVKWLREHANIKLS